MQEHYKNMLAAKTSTIEKLKEYRANMVHNLTLFNQASLEAIKGLDATIAQEGAALHHMIGMMQGRAPEKTAVAPQQTQAPQAEPPVVTQPPSAEAGNGAVVGEAGPVKAEAHAQVSEVIDPATGAKTVFQNGVPVAVTQVQ